MPGPARLMMETLYFQYIYRTLNRAARHNKKALFLYKAMTFGARGWDGINSDADNPTPR
jgi:hypothetical protein